MILKNLSLKILSNVLNILDKFKKPGLYQYENYEQYKKIQTDRNIKTLNRVWVSETDIKLLSDYLKKNVPNLKFGICHGTRRGREQEWFRKYLRIEVIGTEISSTATQFPHTIQWDFHNVKEEWINNVDFIYSNSFDHSYKPEKCLDAWMSCIKKEGVCILEWTSGHTHSTKDDPFGGELEDYKKIITRKYYIKDILEESEGGWKKIRKATLLVIGHRNNE